jgi:HlyD family secretion protein
LTVPIQSLVQRDPASEQALFNNHGKEAAAGGLVTKANLTQGVYIVVQDENRLRVKFVPVTTGVTGATDIEVLSGLKNGDEVVTGRYKVLRTLKSGTPIKRDTSLQTTTDDNSSS